MPQRIVADENFNGAILRGLLRRQADLDIVRVQDVGMVGANDPRLLEWAASQGRILLTHDRATMPYYAYRRIAGGERMPGVFVGNDRSPIGLMIEEIFLMITCAKPSEWDGMIVYLPLN